MARRDRYTYEVVTKEGVTEEAFLAGLDQIGFEIVRNYEFLPRNYRIQAKDRAESMDVQACLAKLVAWELVEDDPLWGEQKTVVGASVTHRSLLQLPIDARGENRRDPGHPTDPLSSIKHTTKYGRHWGVQIAGAVDPSSYPFTSIQDIRDANEVFEFVGELTGNGVDYYILDTGIDPDHPEFDEFEYGYRTIFAPGGDGFYEVGEDDQNHGTGMATCGAGRSMGVAIHSRIIWAKGLDGNNSGSNSALIDGVNAIVAEFIARASEGRPGVMNNSWFSTSSTSFTAAFDAALNAGLIVVASAGNNQNNGGRWPAAYADVISVSAMDMTRNAADFSAFGPTIDVWGPGIDVIQGWRGGSQGWGDGTSPAAGFVTGVICCLLQGYKRPANRSEIQAVNAHIRQNLFHATGIRTVDVNVDRPNTTTRIVRYPRGAQPSLPRIPGLLNLCAQKRHLLGGSSFTKSITKLKGIGASVQAPVHVRRSGLRQDLHIGYPSATIAGDYTTMRPWLVRNSGFANADVTTNLNLLPHVQSLNFNDEDGTPMLVPNNPDAPEVAFMGGNSATGYIQQTIPLDMTPESNPVHFFEFFTNLDWASGDLTGWTPAGPGTPEVKARNSLFFPYVGAYFFEATGGADSSITQVATLPASVNTNKIDAGKMKVYIEADFGRSIATPSTPQDAARLRLIAVDASDTDIYTIFDTGPLDAGSTPTTAWSVHTPSGVFTLPSGTRKLKIVIDAIFVTGTVVNAPVDGLMGWVYEDTNEGRRILEAVRRDLAEVEHTYIRRAFGVDTDDQGRAELLFRDGAGLSIGTTEHDGYKSPHNWTQDWIRRRVPRNARTVRIGVRYNRRAGTAINYHHMFHALWVNLAQSARRLASRGRAITRGGNVEVHSTGFDIAAGTIYRP